MAYVNVDFIELSPHSRDVIELYEAWTLCGDYSFETFCLFFLVLELPFIREYK